MTYKELETIVFEGLGTASVCWDSTTGIFKDELAVQTGNKIMAAINEYADENFAIGYRAGAGIVDD